MKIYPVIPENWKMDGGVAFGVVPKSIWSKLAEPDENNQVRITSRCLLVDEGDRKILFDTGMGNKQSDKYYGFRNLFDRQTIENALSSIGYSAKDIPDVVFTHLHDDHCGGAVRFDENGEPDLVFENALHYVSAAQWDWANQPNSREGASFLKINFIPIDKTGKLKLIDKPGRFSNSIELLEMNGHTQGQLIPKIEFIGITFIFMADFIPSAAHIPLPFIPSVDIQPLITLKEKEAFLEEAVDKNYYLIFEHDFDIECCTLQRTEKGVRMDKAWKLNEILY